MPPRRPKRLTVGDLYADPIRGPRADGRWYWRARRTVDGERVAAWMGWATREELTGVLAPLAVDPKAPRSSTACATVRDLLELWMGEREAVTEDAVAGLRGHEDDVERHTARLTRTLDTQRSSCRSVLRHLDGVRLTAIQADTLARYRRERTALGLSPESIRRELRYLGIAWRWGQEQGHVPPSLALPRVTLEPARASEDYTPTPAEVGAVLRHLDGWPALLTRLLYATGARLGEVTTLRREHLELDDPTRASVRLDGKTGKRTVPLAPVVARELAAELADLAPRDRILPVTPTSANTSLRVYLAEACEAAGCPRWTAHGLRRLAVDRVYASGVDVGTAAALMGHSPEVALRHYRRATEADTRSAVRMAGLGYLPVVEEPLPERPEPPDRSGDHPRGSPPRRVRWARRRA